MNSAKGVIVYDGDTFPRIRLEHMDAGAVRDLTDCATWIDVWRDGVFLVRRPGEIISPKTAGVAEYMLRGAETDFDGAGGNLVVWPFLMVPYGPAGAKATNLLANPGLDSFTGSNPNRLPTGWSLVGAQTSEIFDGYSNDSTPPAVVFSGGSFWFVNPGATSNTYLEQTIVQALAAGDRISVGCWVRASNTNPSVPAGTDDASVMVTTPGDVDYALSRYAAEQDWTFHSAMRVLSASRASLTARLRYKGFNNGATSMRFDEACLFVGEYRRLSVEPIPVKVLPKRVVAKTGGDALAGYGGFERDSDGNGVPDGWQITTISGNGVTASLDADPANVAEGRKSLKLVCAPAASGLAFRFFKRKRFRAGEQWRFTIQYKTSGTLTGSAPNILLVAEPFTNGAGYRMNGSSVAFNQTQPTFATATATITLPADISGLECRLNIGTVNGTFWVDDARLTRI